LKPRSSFASVVERARTAPGIVVSTPCPLRSTIPIRAQPTASTETVLGARYRVAGSATQRAVGASPVGIPGRRQVDGHNTGVRRNAPRRPNSDPEWISLSRRHDVGCKVIRAATSNDPRGNETSGTGKGEATSHEVNKMSGRLRAASDSCRTVRLSRYSRRRRARRQREECSARSQRRDGDEKNHPFTDRRRPRSLRSTGSPQ
jgi:hypothetical protein